jgi:hypothetical protein
MDGFRRPFNNHFRILHMISLSIPAFTLIITSPVADPMIQHYVLPTARYEYEGGQ